MPPYINRINPDTGDPGDRFSVIILGDVFSHVTSCDFGADVSVVSYEIVNDGAIQAKIQISEDAKSGYRDVVLTDPSGNGWKSNGFQVRVVNIE